MIYSKCIIVVILIAISIKSNEQTKKDDIQTLMTSVNELNFTHLQNHYHVSAKITES